MAKGAPGMRICVVGHFVQNPDEGVRNVNHHIARELSKRHEVLKVQLADIGGWRRAKRFKPQILHFILSPSNLGLLAAKMLACYCSEAKTVMSAPHPDRIRWGGLARLFRPDVTLAQSSESEEMFQELGYKTQFLPNGVDTDRFIPVSPQTKEHLRTKYGIERDRFVIMHVASTKPGRNLQLLGDLQVNQTQVLIVGRPSEIRHTQLMRSLEGRGCIVCTAYLPQLEEIYALSDCYVFPTTDRRCCIEMPLSVLEAMSCNLPVITTRFGALPRAFEEGDGLVFADGDDDLVEDVRELEESLEIGTRQKVLPFSWTRIVQELEEVYDGLLQGARA